MDIMPFEKNNNINNKLPRDKNDQNVQSHSKSPIAKCVLDLCSFSENGNDKMLKQITEDKLFSGFSLNLALRRLIPKYDSKNENYIECVNILLQQNIDLNYQNENDNSSTILMIISGNGDVNLIRQIISYKNDNNLSSPINFSMKDNNNFTFIHRKTSPIKDVEKDLVYSTEYKPLPNWKRKINKPTTELEKKIALYFAKDKVFYQDNDVGEIVRNYLLWCGKEVK